MTDTRREARARRRARQHGLRLAKSRSRTPTDPRFGAYWLVAVETNGLVAGGQWGWDLESIIEFLDAFEVEV